MLLTELFLCVEWSNYKEEKSQMIDSVIGPSFMESETKRATITYKKGDATSENAP